MSCTIEVGSEETLEVIWKAVFGPTERAEGTCVTSMDAL